MAGAGEQEYAEEFPGVTREQIEQDVEDFMSELFIYLLEHDTDFANGYNNEVDRLVEESRPDGNMDEIVA